MNSILYFISVASVSYCHTTVEERYVLLLCYDYVRLCWRQGACEDTAGMHSLEYYSLDSSIVHCVFASDSCCTTVTIAFNTDTFISYTFMGLFIVKMPFFTPL